jgi:hypothetical protein
MEDLLKTLWGGPQKREEAQDFVKRYEPGHPTDGYSGQEVMQSRAA